MTAARQVDLYFCLESLLLSKLLAFAYYVTYLNPARKSIDSDLRLDGEGFVWLSKNAFSKPGNELIPAFRTHGSL